jgi:hypothetical protein
MSAANAACNVDKAGADLTSDEVQAVYECLFDDMHAGYAQGDKRWIPAEFVSEYRNWGAASKFPAAPGFHGERFLMTYVNEVGFDAYTDFKEEDVEIPAGTVIAKESFSVGDDGEVRVGPLFIMEKAAAGSDDRTDDWYYMMVSPSGEPQAVNVYAACSACHLENFGYQGGLGYPVPEARIDK